MPRQAGDDGADDEAQEPDPVEEALVEVGAARDVVVEDGESAGRAEQQARLAGRRVPRGAANVHTGSIGFRRPRPEGFCVVRRLQGPGR